MTNKYWEIDNTTKSTKHIFTAVAKADPELKQMTFTVSRYKDTSTQLEQIKVEATMSNRPSGEITAPMSKLASELVNLRDYGIVMARAKFVELEHLIRENFYHFEAIEVDAIEGVINKELAKEIFVLLCQYVENKGIEATTIKDRQTNIEVVGYLLPIVDMNRELAESSYRIYNTTDIRAALATYGYTHTNKNKFDYVATIDNAKVKTICLLKDKATEVLK